MVATATTSRCAGEKFSSPPRLRELVSAVMAGAVAYRIFDASVMRDEMGKYLFDLSFYSSLDGNKVPLIPVLSLQVEATSKGEAASAALKKAFGLGDLDWTSLEVVLVRMG